MKKIVIIGAGMGGLTAGNLLARKGHKVTIFETQAAPGGYTAGFRRKGYYFESGTLSFESSAMVFPAMKELGVFDKINFVRQKGRYLSEDLDFITDSYESCKQIFYSTYPAEKANLDRLFLEMDKIAFATRKMNAITPPFLFNGFKSLSQTIKYLLPLLPLSGLFRKYAKTTVPEFTEKYLGKESRMANFFNNIGYPEMSLLVMGIALEAFTADYWTVKEGFQAWADALADNFRAKKGSLMLNTRVEKILTEGKKAVGVVAGGKSYAADYVLSASDFKKTFIDLLDNKSLLSEAFIKKTKTAEVSEGFVTVYLGLNLSNEILGKCLQVPHVTCAFSRIKTDFLDKNDEKHFEKTGFYLYSPSLINPGHAPAGKSSLMLQAVAPPGWMNNWGGGDKNKYRAFKQKAAEALIARAEKIIPDLMKNIDFADAASPLTYERYTGNTAGATSSWHWNPKKNFYDSLLALKVKTPVKNLLVASQWAVPVGGVPGAISAAYTCSKIIN